MDFQLQKNLLYFIKQIAELTLPKVKQEKQMKRIKLLRQPSSQSRIPIILLILLYSKDILSSLRYKHCHFQQCYAILNKFSVALSQFMAFNSLPNSNQQLYQIRMINDNQKGAMIRHFMSQVKIEDMLNVGFMKPIQVALRTNRTDKSVHADSLPQGLMLADKKTINDNKYQLKKILAVDPTLSYKELKEKNFMDNYISLLKKPDMVEMAPQGEEPSQTTKAKDNQIELGICVSMDKQDKKVLKKTLGGVADNVDEMIKSGVSPDDIFVVVVIDGILKVDPTLLQFFEQLERESQIYLQEDEQLTLKKKYESSLYHPEIQVEEPLNFSKFLFKQEQFYDRVDSKFQHVRKRYDEVLRVKKSVQNIKKEKNKDNDNLKRIINIMMDKQKQILKKISGNENGNVLISEESIMKELASSEEECNQYISTREDLSYVSVYRVPTTSLSPRIREKQTKASEGKDQSETERMYQEESLDKTTRQLSDDNMEKNIINKSKRYVNLFFCIKYKGSGKLSSHNWFFNGFCNQLKPKYSVLLDVGVKPYPTAIFKMYRYLKINQKVGGVCGYLRLIEQKVEDDEMTKSEDIDCISSLLLNIVDIQRAQQIQYHFENMIDKPFESLFRFVHVLPGAFSAYSMDALMPKQKKDSLLRQYFKSMSEKATTNKIATSTFPPGQILMRVFFPKTIWSGLIKIDPDSEEQLLCNEIVNLAEDRILCLGIHKNKRDIVFMPDVFAQVEPVKMINDLMDQRQRTINGAQYSFERVGEELRRPDNTRQMSLFLGFQLFYMGYSKFLSTFAPALLLFTCHVTMNLVQTEYLGSLLATKNSASIGNIIYKTFANIIDFFYILMLMAMVFFSLHLRCDNKKFIYYIYLISTMMGLFTIIAFNLYLIDIINSFFGTTNYIRKQYQFELQKQFPGKGVFVASLLRYFMLSSISVIVIPVTIYSIFFRKLTIIWEMVIGTFSFLFYSPTYLNILQIYAKCRLDDISSGKKSNAKMKQTWKTIKMIQVSKFFIWNLIAGVTLILLDASILFQFYALLFILAMFTFVQSIKLIFGLTYIIRYKCSLRRNPLELTPKQVQDNQGIMRTRIFDIIKSLEIDIKNQIEQSFVIASQETEYLKFEAEMKKEEKQSKSPKKQVPANAQKNKPQQHQIKKQRQSIKLIQQFQDSRFKNIRDSSAIKKDFYPENVGAKRQAKPVIADNQAPLQLLLLKQQLNNSTLNNEGEQKLKQYEVFRGTMRPTIGM